MKFFTKPYGHWPYHLIPYKIWKKGYNKEYNLLIIDCGVNGLKGKREYPYINEYPLLNLPFNVYWVCPDYPFDVGPDLTPLECIEKSWNNIMKWKDLPHVICSIQYEFENLNSFKENYIKLYNLIKIIGIGNLCSSSNINFLKKVINFIINNNTEKKWVHFFGLNKKAIKYLLKFNTNFEITIDSMKWDFRRFKQHEIGTPKNSMEGRWELQFKPYIKDLLQTEKTYKKNWSIDKFL